MLVVQKNRSYFIRPVLEKDREVLEELIANSARALSRDDYTEEEIEAAVNHIFGVDSELIEDKSYFVVEREGEYLACGGWSRRRTLFGGDRYAGRKSGLLDPSTEPANIRAFFVHPKHTRQGIGAALLLHCEEQARSHGFSAAQMMATLPGVKLYQACGYEAEEMVRYSTPDGEVRFVPMRKRL
jgi:GNAT superfamily N-acetyltransferase